MPVLFSNVTFDVWRSTYSAITGATSPTQPYLTQQIGHIGPVPQTSLILLQQSGVEADYALQVESGLDVSLEDQIVGVTLLNDGVTAWPGLSNSANTNITFWVRFVQESAPPLLMHRTLYLSRVQTAGRVHL